MRPPLSTRPTPVVSALVGAVLLLGGCGRVDLGEVVDGSSPPKEADAVVTVTVGSGTCEVSSTAIERGSLAIVVANDTTKDARFRFYSGGIDPIGEIRTLEGGTTRTLLLNSIVPGDYVAACTVDGGDEVRTAMRAGKEPL